MMFLNVMAWIIVSVSAIPAVVSLVIVTANNALRENNFAYSRRRPKMYLGWDFYLSLAMTSIAMTLLLIGGK